MASFNSKVSTCHAHWSAYDARALMPQLFTMTTHVSPFRDENRHMSQNARITDVQ